MSGRFAGRLAVVTGAAGDIGLATALRLAAEGARVFVVDRDDEAVDRALAAVRRAGGTAAGTAADVADAQDAERYARAAATELGDGAIHAFFNNAGSEGPIGPIERVADEEFDAVIATNVRGVYLGMKHVLPYMPEGGAIVNTGSVGSVCGSPNLSAYVASKHAVLGLTRSIALEVARRGIRVNAVCPGPVQGRMIRAIEEGLGAGRADLHARMVAAVPLRRFAQPDEIAAAVAYLLSDDAAFVTGTAHLVDGGSRA